MKIIILCCVSLILSFSFGKGNMINDPSADLSIKQLFSDYQKALIGHDTGFPEKWFVTDREYHELLDFVSKNQPNCVGPDEASFSTEINSRVYKDILSSKLVISRMDIKRIEYNYSCGNLLEIPRVICSVQYADKKVIDVPFLLVKIKNNEYKILKNFLNYKIFSND